MSIKGLGTLHRHRFYLVRGMDFSKSDKHTYFAAVSGKTNVPARHPPWEGNDQDGSRHFPLHQGGTCARRRRHFKTTGKLFIWISDDYRRLPVMVKTEITIGSVVAELSGFIRNRSKTKNGFPAPLIFFYTLKRILIRDK